jgi:hypothetical protein
MPDSHTKTKLLELFGNKTASVVRHNNLGNRKASKDSFSQGPDGRSHTGFAKRNKPDKF